MAGDEGIEPVIVGFGDRCSSIELSSCMVPARGLEPQSSDSKSEILPLDEAGMGWKRGSNPVISIHSRAHYQICYIHRKNGRCGRNRTCVILFPKQVTDL